MGGMIEFVVANQTLVLVVLAIVAVVAVVAILYLFQRGSKKAKQQAGAPAQKADPKAPPPPRLRPRDMRRLFRQGLSAYRHRVAASRNLNLVPWFVAIGPEEAGKATLFSAVEPARAAGADPLDEYEGGCRWRFYDNAVVLDIQGNLIVPKDGSKPGDGMLRTLLSELRRKRWPKAADGIILTIPATELLDPQGLPKPEATVMARAISDRLWQAQRVLGLCLPVYVVVTKCDMVPAFAPFAAALAPPMRDTILGWSNPYPLDMAYRGEWVDEAFSSLSADLLSTLVEVFADDAVSERAEEVFAFPSQLAQLRAPLRQQLDIILRQTGYQEALFLRGIYFTGTTVPDAAETWSPLRAPVTLTMAPMLPPPTTAFGIAPEEPLPVRPTTAEAKPVVTFARDLLTKKIFAERELSRPAARWSFERDRVDLFWQVMTGIAAVVALVLLWIGYNRTSEMAASAQPVLERTAALMRRAETAPGPAAQNAVIEELVRNYDRLEEEWTLPWFLGARLGGLPQRISIGLSVGYHRVVMQTVRDRLVERGRGLAQAPAGNVTGADADFLRIREMLGEAVLMERYAVVYNGIVGTSELNGLPELVRYTTDIELPPEFMARAASLGFVIAPDPRLLQGATIDGALRAINLADYRAAASARLEQLFGAFADRVGQGSESMARLREAAARIDAIASGRAQGAAPLQALLRDLRGVGTGFSVADKLLVSAPGLGPDIEPLLGVIAESQLFGPQVRDRIAARLREAVIRASTEFRSLTSAIGPLAVLTPQGQIALSEPAQGLMRNLDALFRRPFMQSAGALGSGPLLRAEPSVWNIEMLDGAATAGQDFALFLTRDLGGFPEPLRSAVRAASQDRLREVLLSRTRAAQQPLATGDDPMRQQVRSFATAAPLLLDITRRLQQEAGLTAEAAALSDALGNRVLGLLAQVDQALESAQFFVPASGRLAGWNGGSLDAARLFGVPSLGALTEMVGEQRQSVAAMANDLAKPLLDYLSAAQVRPAERQPLITKWTRIMAEVDRAGAGSPEASLTRLSTFIATDLNTIDLENCRTVLGRATSAAGTDWFSDRVRAIATQVGERCGGIVQAQVSSGYRQLADAFNRLLAGRYPFSRTGDTSAESVSLAAVVEFFRLYDEVGPAVTQAAPTMPPTSRNFLQNLARVRAFLGPLLPGPDAAEPGYGIEARFRVNQGDEAGGRDIIEWQVYSGLQVTSNFAPQRIQWRPGMPVEVRLRWARDGFITPVSSEGGFVDQANRSVAFAYRDTWSLIRLLQRHAAQRGSVLRPNVLMFESVVERVQGGPTTPSGNEGAGQARVFLELSVTGLPAPAPPGAPPQPAPAGRVELPLFPAEAPFGSRSATEPVRARR